MALPLSNMPVEILREVRSRKWLVFFAFLIVSFAVLAAGFLWPYKYRSEVTIFVDDQNIIRPLMEGSAVTTEISEQTSSARQTLSNRDLLTKVAIDVEIFGEGAQDASNAVIESRIGELRSNLGVEKSGGQYFAITYSSESPLKSFRIAQRLGQLFIEESTASKRIESRNAYDFIDKQVKSYEQQIAQVEKRLERFLSENKEGTEEEASSRMSSLKNQLELAQLERRELQSRVESLQGQLANIDPMVRQGRTSDAYQQRIGQLEAQLDELRLRYLDTYPDIVILKEQIAELKEQRRRALEQGAASEQTIPVEEISNPFYQELRLSVSRARADLQTIDTRIQSLNSLIAEQEVRMERIQANKTQYAEITRDMAVNRQIYNDLLRRREKARVSMHLDVEGQGLNYEIYESAQYPMEPYDMKFSTFALAGLFLGVFFPFGTIAGLLQIDPRVRAREQLEEDLGLPILAEIPKVRTPYEKRRERTVTFTVVIVSVIAVTIYIAIAISEMLGVI